jgi:ABC-type Fe3+-hydroxamate transport system substrate-binding protein
MRPKGAIMRKHIMLLGISATLAGCGQSAENGSANNATNTASAEKPKAAYCFFKDAETKGWTAKADKSGNVVVTGKAYREDARYKALLSPATVAGNTAEIAPSIGPNDTGFAAPDNWWTLNETIPNSQAVETVTVKCGDETIATLKVPRQK